MSRLEREIFSRMPLSTVVLPYYGKAHESEGIMKRLRKSSRKLWWANLEQWEFFLKPCRHTVVLYYNPRTTTAMNCEEKKLLRHRFCNYKIMSFPLSRNGTIGSLIDLLAKIKDVLQKGFLNDIQIRKFYKVKNGLKIEPVLSILGVHLRFLNNPSSRDFTNLVNLLKPYNIQLKEISFKDKNDKECSLLRFDSQKIQMERLGVYQFEHGGKNCLFSSINFDEADAVELSKISGPSNFRNAEHFTSHTPGNCSVRGVDAYFFDIIRNYKSNTYVELDNFTNSNDFPEKMKDFKSYRTDQGIELMTSRPNTFEDTLSSLCTLESDQLPRNLKLVLTKGKKIPKFRSIISFDKGVVVTVSKKKRRYIEVENASLFLTKNEIKVHNGFILGNITSEAIWRVEHRVSNFKASDTNQIGHVASKKEVKPPSEDGWKTYFLFQTQYTTLLQSRLTAASLKFENLSDITGQIQKIHQVDIVKLP